MSLEDLKDNTVEAFGRRAEGRQLGEIQTVRMPFGCVYRWFQVKPDIGSVYELGPLRDKSGELLMERFVGIPIRVAPNTEVIAALKAVQWRNAYRLPRHGVWCEIQVD